MVHDRTQQQQRSGQVADNMFSSTNIGTPKKNKMLYGTDEGEFDMAAYLAQGSSSAVADMLGQSGFASAFYGQQNSASVGNRSMNSQPFGRSMSVPGGHITPTSGDNASQINQTRGILPMSRNTMGGNQMPTSQIGNNLLSNRPGMPSPTRGISPIDLFNMKQSGSRGLSNTAISRTQSFTSQTMPISAIGSENISQHRQQPLSGSSSLSHVGMSGLNPFNLDQNEFPALAQRTRPIGSQPTSTNSVKGPYVGMLNKQSEHNEFQIHNEDFPALPGAAAMNVMKAVFPEQDGRGDESQNKFNPLGSLQIGGPVTTDKSNPKQSSTSGPQKGIQVFPDNSIKHIPNSMLTDQYGIVGLFAFIKAAETDPTLVHLALGNDLTTLGLNLNSPDNLYHKFQSPFIRQPCRLQDIDFFVPSEYLTNAHIRDKLAPIKLNRYGEDLLFYVYYTNPGDVLQLAAAAELYNRDWRYHKEERIWITRAPGIEPRTKTSTYEQGTYYYFDCQNWRKVAKEFHLEYDKLEERPHLPNLVSLHFNPAQHS
uniref:CCR4-NOT transcription complex subunit 2 n=1 Tax=Phallusia mammillata TaxID=59560 RepID=A0A6F9D926_9ASCI|nr:CCR4-NOT transcription complex subunit 2 [Phallusia mammillata]